MKPIPSAATGMPRASATAASSDAKRRGRAIAMTTIATSAAITAASRACPALRPKIEPNSTRTPATPLLPLRLVVTIDRKSAPSPRIQAKTVPTTTSSAWARPASAPIAAATATVAMNSPKRTSTPAAAAASAPVNATWLSASLANTWLRRTTK